MRLWITFTLMTICLTATGQTSSIRQKPLTYYPYTYIDTESLYIDSTGIDVIIQNSLPKGGGHTDATGKKFEYRIFWTRVINKTDKALELTINFPADSFSISASHESYLKVFLPPDTMGLEKETLYNYGATGLKSFLYTGLNNPTRLQRIINPKEACVFYIGVLFTHSYGPARAELILKEQELFYRIRGIAPQYDSELIPCGKIVFK